VTSEWLIPVSCMAGLVVMAALMRLLARAHEALTGAGIPAEGALLARLARLIEERNQLRAQLYEATK